MSSFRIAVFASGSGSNFQAIIDHIQEKKLDLSIELLVCDKPGAKVIERAEIANIPVFAFRPKEYVSREAYEQEIVKELQKKQIDLIVLAGYMRLVTDTLVKPYYGKMINIHPSLLPSFPGLDAIGQAYEYGVKVTGVTVHFVDNGMDTGPIINQESVIIEESDTLEQLENNIHKVEHRIYSEVIDWIAEGRVQLQDRKVNVLPQKVN
ncbi:phosphoribosylglycinamide formyltransferase [Chengkuizengella axinellae]|uniref:Phosphoribosylglycinamide formyltransferase n=1 Tax=Chengkuizengella axinellae TaxID=3064388 RepID=A0ABT9J640_9BACL|nr:phosphoribosylglycinamide formyltransferase [Chengkuizengella sp. 2205SS18-9]MDP5277088.1 phosphoribosylglycinamide formyltransferase [Chengkuizengella sp. 2205SS18-9]